MDECERMIHRRAFIAGLFCAPAIVRASSLMKIFPVKDDGISLQSIPHPGWPDEDFTTDNLLIKATETYHNLYVSPAFVHSYLKVSNIDTCREISREISGKYKVSAGPYILLGSKIA